MVLLRNHSACFNFFGTFVRNQAIMFLRNAFLSSGVIVHMASIKLVFRNSQVYPDGVFHGVLLPSSI